MNHPTHNAGSPLSARDTWRDDWLAAAIVTVLLVPQSLAYAMLAGLPPVVGITASLLPAVAYAAFGSSSTLAVGPVAVMAMMSAQVVAPLAQAHGVSMHEAAIVLAFEVGAILLLASALRLDALAALLSAPVLHGFVTGASLAIAFTQLPILLGAPVQGSSPGELVHAWWSAWQARAASWSPHGVTSAVGLVSIVALVFLRMQGKRWLQRLGLSGARAELVQRMAPMLVVLLAVAWAYGFRADAAPAGAVALVGPIQLSAAWQLPAFWQTPPSLWMALLPAAGLLGLVAYVESLAVAEALGAKRGERVRPLREMIGLGAANAVAGVTGAMPVAGSFSRSIVNFDAGARTRWAGVYAVVLLLAAVAVAGPVLQYLPKAVLAATIIVAVLSLVDFKPFVQTWHQARAEFGMMLVVALLTIVWGVEQALLVGVLASVAWFLKLSSRPHWAEVGRMPGTDVFRNVKRHAVITHPSLLAMRIDEGLVFTNTRWLSDTVNALLDARPAVRDIVLMMPGVNHIDWSGLEGLKSLVRDLGARGVVLHLSEVKGPIHDQLLRADLKHWLTGRVFMTQHEADLALAPGTDLGAQAQGEPRKASL